MTEKDYLRNECVKKMNDFAERMDGRIHFTPEEEAERIAIGRLLNQYHQMPDPDSQREKLRVSFLEIRKEVREMSVFDQMSHGLEKLREVESEYLKSILDDLNS